MENASRRYSLGLRIWHWLDAVVVLGLLLTYLLRKFVLDRTLAGSFQAKLAEHHIVISDDIAKELRHLVVDRLWDWHVKLGYALAALLVWRLVLSLVDRDARILKSAWLAWRDRPPGLRGLQHAAVKALYVLFYLGQTVMVSTGLGLAFSETLGLSDQMTDGMKEVHEALVRFFVAFVLVHISGVLIAENGSEPGLASGMINGGGRKTIDRTRIGKSETHV